MKPILSIITFIPAVGALLLTLLRNADRRLVYRTAILFSFIPFALTLWVLGSFDSTATELQFAERHSWIPSIGAEYFLGIDGLGLLSLLLTGIVMLLAILASNEIKQDASFYFSLLLLLQTGMYRRIYGVKLLPLVYFLGTQSDPGIFPNKTLGRLQPFARCDTVFHLYLCGERDDALVLRGHLCGEWHSRFHGPCRKSEKRRTDISLFGETRLV